MSLVRSMTAIIDQLLSERARQEEQHLRVLMATFAMKHALEDAVAALLRPTHGIDSEAIAGGMKPLPEGKYPGWVKRALSALREFDTVTEPERFGSRD